MSLIEHLKEAARHLKEATQMARDFRVRDAVANGGTLVNCAIHLQKKIAAGQERAKTEPPHVEGSV